MKGCDGGKIAIFTTMFIINGSTTTRTKPRVVTHQGQCNT
jgi:hypothetical protein